MVKRNKEYWRERFEKLENYDRKITDLFIKNLAEHSEKAQYKIESQIEGWYQRLAINNDISLQAAKKILNDKELKEFKWTLEEYIEKGRENAVNQKWLKELENASARVHIEKLEAQKILMQAELEELYNYKNKTTQEFLEHNYEDRYYKTIFEGQKGFEIGYDINKLESKAITKAVMTAWANDGKNFSDRIWEDKNKLVDFLNTSLTQSLILGENSDTLVKKISKEFNVRKHRAATLAYTEMAVVASKSSQQAFKRLDVDKYEILAEIDSVTSEICKEMNGKIFSMSDFEIGVTAPPFHPNCRTTTMPYYEDDIENKLEIDKKEDIETSEKDGIIKVNKENNFYKKYGEEHVDSIHSIVKNSDVNIQKAWAKYENNFNILSINYKGTPHNERGKFGGVHLNILKDAEVTDYRNKYSVSFHELGHHIDNLASMKTESFYSMFSSTYKDGIFQKTIIGEIETKIKNIEEKLKAEYKSQGKKYYKAYAYRELSKELYKLPKIARTDISDIIEGATKGKASGGFGHGKKYWKDRPTGVGNEAFAEMFDATINNIESRKMLELYLPESVKIFDEMMNEIGGGDIG